MFRVTWFALILLLFAADVVEAGCRRGGGRFRHRGGSCGGGNGAMVLR